MNWVQRIPPRICRHAKKISKRTISDQNVGEARLGILATSLLLVKGKLLSVCINTFSIQTNLFAKIIKSCCTPSKKDAKSKMLSTSTKTLQQGGINTSACWKQILFFYKLLQITIGSQKRFALATWYQVWDLECVFLQGYNLHFCCTNHFSAQTIYTCSEQGNETSANIFWQPRY